MQGQQRNLLERLWLPRAMASTQTQQNPGTSYVEGSGFHQDYAVRVSD